MNDPILNAARLKAAKYAYPEAIVKIIKGKVTCLGRKNK